MGDESSASTEIACWQHEVRFGVVMYGGVSLAVYINGVVQELLALVRATAPAAPGQTALVDGPLRFAAETLTPIERVYRDLGRVAAPDAPGSLEGPVTTRFVVDIISGSSAGGINGVYLAKALSKNLSITSLKDLWVDRAGFGNILNDRTGRNERTDALTKPDPGASLFSGDRMYLELLDALDGMDAQATAAAEAAGRPHDDAPLVPDMDLWLTATDLEGIVEPLQLADRTVPERRHRHVFHFFHGQTHDPDRAEHHFTSDRNPILAFAARATSSFPFAFEPAQLVDIERVLRTKHDPRGRSKADDPAWRSWFSRHCDIPGYDHTRVSFGDGGDMDNKPFSWVIDTLPSRTSTTPVDRRLLYVEPDPGDVRQAAEPPPRPDVVSSVITAISLGRVEQIRDEVERLARRSETLDQIAAAAEELHDRFRSAETEPQNVTTQDWMTEPPEAMRLRGPSYQTYYRMRIEALVNDFGRSLAQLGWTEPTSATAAALRGLTRKWVSTSYSDPFRTTAQPSTKEFLRDYDIAFRIRRLAFAAHWADQEHRRAASGDVIADDGTSVDAESFRIELRRIKQLFGQAELLLRSYVPGARFGWRRTGPDEPFPLSPLDLRAFRRDPNDWIESTWTRRSAEWMELVTGIAAVLSTPYDPENPHLFKQASTLVSEALRPEREPDAPAPDVHRARGLARNRVDFVYQQFGNFDQVMFPIQVAAGGGEIDSVDVFRISPQDASSLVDESETPKVAGARFFHFGGFLDKGWRANDIMWGRLDTAERLITTLAPPEHRAELLERAHDAILLEEWFVKDRPGAGAMPPTTGSVEDDRKARIKQFRATFAVPDWPDRSSLLHLAARSSQVTADVLEGAADLPGAKPAYRLVAGVAWILTAAATVLFPGGVKRSPIRALSVAAAGIGVALILAGSVFGWQTGTDAGRTAVGAGLAGMVAILLARLGWRRPVRFIVAGGIGLLLALAFIGGQDLEGSGLRTAAIAAGVTAGVGVVGIILAVVRSIPATAHRAWMSRRARRSVRRG